MENRVFDFESIIDRMGYDALAVEGLGKIPGFAPEMPDEGFDLIPMWVADMNFKVPSCVTDAVRKRLDHPLFGYFRPRDDYYDSIIRWHETRNHVEGLKPEHIGYENGVLGGLVAALQALLPEGGKVMLHRPTYVGFTSSVTNAGYELVHSDLVQDEAGIWRMDFEDMDRKIKENGIKVCIFCNPHNPCGRVWSIDEMQKAAGIYEKNGCTVISDEIWSDIILSDNHFTPFHMVNDFTRENTVTLCAPSKTFNLAGLIGSYHIIFNKELRDKVRDASSKSHYNGMNVLSMHALIGAYTDEGMAWVDELRKVLDRNIDYACNYIEENLPEFRTTKPEGTYMLFIDCEEWCRSNSKTMDELLKAGWKVGVAWQDGRPFKEGSYIRLNLALPFSRVKEAFDRVSRFVY